MCSDVCDMTVHTHIYIQVIDVLISFLIKSLSCTHDMHTYEVEDVTLKAEQSAVLHHVISDVELGYFMAAQWCQPIHTCVATAVIVCDWCGDCSIDFSLILLQETAKYPE